MTLLHVFDDTRGHFDTEELSVDGKRHKQESFIWWRNMFTLCIQIKYFHSAQRLTFNLTVPLILLMLTQHRESKLWYTLLISQTQPLKRQHRSIYCCLLCRISVGEKTKTKQKQPQW